MRVLRGNPVIAALGTATLLGLSIGGCSSSAAGKSAAAAGAGQSSAPAVSGAGSAPSATASATGLAAHLLTPADLPAGWKNDVTPSNPAMQTDCTLLNTSIWSTALTEHAEADMNAGMAGPFLVEQISAGDPAQATKAWNALVSGLPKCTSYTHGGANGSSTFSFARATLPTYGDSSYSFTLGIQLSSGIGGNGYIVAAHNGNTVLVIYVVGVTPLDKTFVDTTMNKAVSKART